LGRDPLFDWDEGIYGELGRQLLSHGHFLTSFWNGLPWFEKPPGIAWVSAIGMSLAGVSSLGARLLMPLFATSTLYMVYRIGYRLGGWRQGLLAAGVLATFNLFLGRTRALNVDMPLLLGITTTIVLLLENKRPVYLALVIALSVWFKGLAGLLAVLISLPLFLSKSKNFLLSTMYYVLIFTLPWHLYSYLRYGSEFVTPYILEQVLRRVTAPIEFHMESRYFYFNYLYENLGLGVILVSLLGAFCSIKKIKDKDNSATYLTIIWWLLFPLGIFTFSKTRLFWYILPVYPAIALLISEIISRFTIVKNARLAVSILAIGVACQGILVTFRSVEAGRATSPLSDRLTVANAMQSKGQELAVLVPLVERRAEAILPAELRLSSSFRYGGMPSVVFYYEGPVKFFYNVDEFLRYWEDTPLARAMIERADLDKIGQYHIDVETPTYLGLSKEVYALR